MTDDLAAILWGIHGNWPWAGVVVLAVICVAFSVGIYVRQMRTVPRAWWVLMLTLRSVAFVAICLSLLQPTVLRPESASEAGGIAILIDRSRSMSAIDTGDDPAAQVAAAAALNLFPNSLRDDKTLALRQRIDSLRAMLEETRRSLIEQQYSQFTQGSNSTLSVHMADLLSRWGIATSPMAGEPLTASLADLSEGINQPGWADRSEKKIDDVLGTVAAVQVHRDADLYEHSEIVRQACARLSAMSRLDRGRAAVTEFIAHLPSSVPVYGAFFDSKLTPAILRKNGKSVWPEDMTADGDESDITGAVRELLPDMNTTPLRAILIFSDGRQVGGTLASLSNQSNPPIFPILCAGTPRDLVLHQLIAPRSAYLDEPLSIRSEIRSAHLAEIPVEVSLQSGNLISRQVVSLDHAGIAVADFLLTIPHVGEQSIRVSIPPIAGEASIQNNHAQLRISVAPQRIKIALLASFPNRDFQFLRDQLRQSPWIDSTVILPGQSTTPAQLGQQQVIVFDDLAAGQLDAAQWNAIHAATERGNTGLIFIAGSNHLPAEYLSDPRLSALLPFDTTAGPPTWRTWAGANAYFRFQPTSSIAPFLSLEDDTDLARQWDDLPAMYHYLQIPRLRAAAQPLLLESESASPVLTEMPLGKGRIFFLGFNETWRWRQENIALPSRFWRQLLRHAAPLSDETQQQIQPSELADLSPQPSLLARLASPSAAEVIPLSDVKSLWPKIQQYQRTHPAVIEYPLWHSPWLFAFVLGCFGAEWALRKRFGLA